MDVKCPGEVLIDTLLMKKHYVCTSMRAEGRTDRSENIVNKEFHMMACHSTQATNMNRLSASDGWPNRTMLSEREYTAGQLM